MKEISLFLIHLLTAVAGLFGPGGVKGIITENLPLKQQLIVVCRPRQRAPKKIDDFRWQTHCRGLVQLPVAA